MCPWVVGLPLSLGSIVDALQFSQKGLHMAVKARQMEELELKSKYEQLHVKWLEMGEIIDRLLGIVPKVMEEAQKQELAKTET